MNCKKIKKNKQTMTPNLQRERTTNTKTQKRRIQQALILLDGFFFLFSNMVLVKSSLKGAVVFHSMTWKFSATVPYFSNHYIRHSSFFFIVTFMDSSDLSRLCIENNCIERCTFSAGGELQFTKRPFINSRLHIKCFCAAFLDINNT